MYVNLKIFVLVIEMAVFEREKIEIEKEVTDVYNRWRLHSLSPKA